MRSKRVGKRAEVRRSHCRPARAISRIARARKRARWHRKRAGRDSGRDGGGSGAMGARINAPPSAKGREMEWAGARRREQGEGVSRSRTRRGASEARRDAATGARSAMLARGRAEIPLPAERTRLDGGRKARAGPKGSQTRRAPWELRSQRWRTVAGARCAQPGPIRPEANRRAEAGKP